MQETVDDKIAANRGLIFAQLNKFSLAHDPEAESIGYEALYNAISTYEQEKHVQFSTYASVCIYNALGSYVRTLNKQRQLEIISYNNVAYTADGTEHEFVDFIEAPAHVEADYERAECCLIVREAVRTVYDSLTNSKHKSIVRLWVQSDYTMTFVSIAKEVGVTQPYVSQVINSFKAKLKKQLEEYYYG